MIFDRYSAVKKQLRELEETVQVVVEAVDTIRHQVLRLQAKGAVSAREAKKEDDAGLKTLLGDLLGGEVLYYGSQNRAKKSINSGLPEEPRGRAGGEASHRPEEGE